MNNQHFSNPGTSKSAVRSRGLGSNFHGYPLRYPMNTAIASSAVINNSFGGYNNAFPVEHSNGTSAAAAVFNNHCIPRGHPIVTPVVCGITDPFSATSVGSSNEYTSELTAEYTTYATDDDGSGNTDVSGPTPSEFAKIMRHYELLRSFEELNAKVQNGNICTISDECNEVDKYSSKPRDAIHNNKDEIYNYLPQIKAAHLLRKIGKFSVNSAHHTASNLESKFKNVEQQTEAIQQRNVAQQTFPHCCNEDNNSDLDEPFSQPDVKRRKTCDCRLLDTDKRYAAVESMRLPIQKINLKGVAGLSDVKIVIRETFLLPLTHPHLFQLFPGTVKRCCRCLLYGPPGTGKTLLAQAIASELEASLYYVSCAGILSCYIGESEKNVKELFEHALEQQEPSIIFFDEIDSVCRKRTEGESEHSRRLKTELLRYFENPAMEESQVYVLSATNCPWDLDPAFLRRFQRHIYIPLPDREARQQIIAQRLGGLRILLSQEDWDQILNQTEGFSGSDLTNFVSIAVAQPNREILRATHWRCFDGERVIPCDPSAPNAFQATVDDVPPEKVIARSVVLSDFLYAAQETPKTVTDEHIQQFENFKKQFTR